MTRMIVELCEHGEAKPHNREFIPLEPPIYNMGGARRGRYVQCPGGRVLEDMLDALALIATSWEGEKCNQCGKPYADVYSLPDELWARIHERAPAGLLCPVCALGRVGRVLEQAIIIERDTDGKWPVWAYQAMDRAEKAAYEKGNRAFLYEYLDALASAQENQQ